MSNYSIKDDHSIKELSLSGDTILAPSYKLSIAQARDPFSAVVCDLHQPASSNRDVVEPYRDPSFPILISLSLSAGDYIGGG